MTTLADQPPRPESELHEDRTILSKAADRLYPGAGWTVYQWWRNMNEDLFGRQLQTCGIQFGRVGSDGSVRTEPFGEWRGREGVIVLGRSLLHQHGKVWRLYHPTLGEPFVRDVLLHQMVHQYIEAVRGVSDGGRGSSPTGSPHNNRWWAAEVNRLTEALELSDRRAAVLPADVPPDEVPEGILTIEEAAQWPFVGRPGGGTTRRIQEMCF